MAIAKNCWESGFGANCLHVVLTVERMCNELSNVAIGLGSRFTSFPSATTYNGKPVDFVAKVWFAGKMLGNELVCDQAAMPGPDKPYQLPHGFGVSKEAHTDAFMKIVDRCDDRGENNKHGGYAADKCLIYLLDPNDRETGQ